MKQFFIVCSFLSTIAVNAQTTFQKGYFVTKNSQQTECLIKNYDWNKIPTEIEYKLEESGEVKKVYAANLQSFQIYNTSQMYREYDVPVTQRQGAISIKPGLQLLKVLAEGEATLLENGDGVYFLHIEGQPVKPLFYSQFINTETGREETDNSFRLELYNSLKCESIKSDNLRKVRYTEKQLVNVIADYNNCMNSGTLRYIDKRTGSDFNLKIVAGVTSYKSSIGMPIEGRFGIDNEERLSEHMEFDGGSGNGFTVGFEAEVRLPFNHRKWALFVIPTYNLQKGFTQEFLVKFRSNPNNGGHFADYFYGGTITLEDFAYLEIPVGIRHYFILNKNSELNLSASYGVSVPVGGKPNITFERKEGTVQIDDEFDKVGFSLFRLGAGYSYKNYSIAFNYYARKAFSHSSSNGSISVLLGYKIL